MPSSLQFSADFCITRRVFKPSPPPGSPAHSAGPPRNYLAADFWPPEWRTFMIFGRFLHTSKIIKKSHSSKHLPKAVEVDMLRPLGRPKSISNDSGIDFGLILASFFHKKSYFFGNRQKHENLIKPMKNQWFCTPKPPIFASIFDQNFMLVPNAFQNLFFPPFGRQSAPKSRRIEFFGPILGSLGAQLGPKKVPKIVQVSPKASKKASGALTFWAPGINQKKRSTTIHGYVS